MSLFYVTGGRLTEWDGLTATWTMDDVGVPDKEPEPMTDEPQPTPDEAIQAEAKVLAAKPPEPVEGAADLPDDVRDGDAEPTEETPMTDEKTTTTETETETEKIVTADGRTPAQPAPPSPETKVETETTTTTEKES